MKIYGRAGRPVGEAAAVIAHLAAVPLDSGVYYHGLAPADPASLVRNRKAVGHLWRRSAGMTGLA